MGKGIKKSKVILVVSVVVVALVVGAIAFFSVNALQASDDSALPSYTKKDMDKTLGSPENPYTILEIVPDEESAALGYLISGQEPQNLKAIGSTDLKNPDSAAAIYKEAFASATSPSAYVGDRANAYIFDADKASIGTTPVSGFAEKEDKYESEASPGTDMAYSEFGYFTKVSGGKGAYNYDYTRKCFIPAAGGNYTWTSVGEFQHVGTGQVPQGSVPCARMLDNSQGEDRGYTYDSDKNTGAVGESAFKYYYSPMGDFVWVPNNYFNNEDIFRENATDTELKAAKDGDKLYMTRTEKKYYVYESSVIICNDIPIKYLVGPDATAMTFKTQIVSVTPKQLKVDDFNTSEADKAKDLIDTCDAIYVHNSAIGYRIADALNPKPASGEEKKAIPRNFDKSSTSGDLSLKTAERIIERGDEGVSKDAFGQVVKGPAAIIFDEEAIKTANSYVNSYGNPDNTKNCANLKLLYDVYNNLGAKLAYNWMSGSDYSDKLSAASAQQGYRNFSYNEADALGKSQFVYNYTGEDDSWLTTDFGNESKVAKTALNAPAFTDVNTFINADCGNSMSVAKMFMAINLEADAYNQPDHLRILEIEPNEQYMYDANNKDSWVKYYLDLMPWYVGTSADIGKDVTITAMPTWEFIGKNEDVNENYDMIIVGNKQQDETNGAQGYNDPNMNVTWYGQTKGFSYTAVGDLITTFGGDAVADADPEREAYYINRIKNNKFIDEDYNRWEGTKENNFSERKRKYDLDYKWKWGLLQNSKWINSWNGEVMGYSGDYYGEYYEWGFQAKLVAAVVGGGDALGSGGLRWWYQKNAKNHNFVYGTKHGSDANMIGLRYAGNDLTKKKYDQLVDYSTQAPLIVSDDLYWPEDNPFRDYAFEITLDKSSFVYKLADKNKDDDTTVYKHARAIEANSRLNDVKNNLLSYNCNVTFTNTNSGKEGLPREYKEDDATNYNQQMNSAGNNVLEYHFVLEGDKNTNYGVDVYTDSNSNGIFEGSISHEKERAINHDKSEYDSEKSTNLTIFDETDKRPIYDGILVSGHTYLVTKVLPDSELGMVPWKLEIYKKDNPSVRFSKIGYTRIKPKDSSQVKEIKVLQMNLNYDMTNNLSNSINFANNYWYTVDYDGWGDPVLNARLLTDNNKTDFQKQMSRLLDVDDFNIKVDYMDNTYWAATYKGDSEKWRKALMEYDMLVIGFQDMAQFTNDETYIAGFEAFRDAGKSIILSHDLVADATIDIQTNKDNWDKTSVIQADVRYYLRDISGQIRKYYNAADYNDKVGGDDYDYFQYYLNGEPHTFEPNDYFKIYTAVYEEFNSNHNREYLIQDPNDVANTPIYNKYTYTLGKFDDWHYTVDWDQSEDYGIWVSSPIQVIRDYYENHEHKPAGLIMDNSLRAMLYYNNVNYVNNQFNDKLDRYVDRGRTNLTWNTGTFATYKVKSVNEGQITKYPYEIPPVLDVAQTHVQNYQLDLEYDNEGDVLVWYNLAGDNNKSIYYGRDQDCRNNYYIYTKGNVTYTGLGHSGGMTDTEMRLFVNTMVASYRSGAAEPYITVTNPDAVSNGKNTTMYLEDRDNAGSNTTINYRIDDDTTNSKIVRTYNVKVYKDGVLLDNESHDPAYNSGTRPEGYTIPVSYSDVKANSEVTYTIELYSTYKNDDGDDVNTKDTRTVTVALMPMFDLR